MRRPPEAKPRDELMQARRLAAFAMKDRPIAAHRLRAALAVIEKHQAPQDAGRIHALRFLLRLAPLPA
jgi:hypothetical protein